MPADRLTHGLLALAASLAIAAPVGARTPDRIDEAVAVATQAVRDAFGGDADVELSHPVLSLVADAAPIARAVPEPSSRTGGPVRFVLHGAGDTPRRLGRLTARVHVRARHVRVRSRVAARAVIGAGAVEEVRDDIGRQAFGPLPGADTVTGATTRRTLLDGEIVTRAVLVTRALVASGDEVVTVARLGALEVRGRAIAAQAGDLGETIIVVNPDSRRRLRGRVVAEDLVEVLHGS